ncbi:Hypothetical protein CAP_5164 [Chondromyces apiculatus DSM 436]|uniref:Peptidase S8 n=2 Tax=Chondromyces apiculatus TaxID=51 RepID=A0A017T3A7_9BACT|nr:Hypothetical protein CAP_5164 [Chondromyces apiculatus DSM 436]
MVAGMTGCGTGTMEVPLEGPGAPGQATFSPDEPTELYLVEFEVPSLSRGGSEELLDIERVDFREQAAARNLRYRERFTFGDLWNGLSIQIGADDATEIARMPHVKAVFPVVPFELDEGDTPPESPEPTSDPELAGATTMSGATVVRDSLGLTGHGVFVAVIDTGIDYHHPDLGNGCFGPGCRVAFGRDFVGNVYDSANTTMQPTPDADPDDCGGHGTHVAGIIGASGGVTGVAPEVTLGAYKVFGCSGSTSADIMIAAMQQARADGARVVNMSIGSPFAWPEYPSAVAADQLVEQGVVVVTSGGNSGDGGLFATGAPGTGKRVIASAALNNKQQSLFSFSADATPYGYSRATAAPVSPLSGSLPLVRTGTITSDADACTALPAGSLAGKAVLIRRGGCTFYVKAQIAQNAGAAAVILYNNTSGALSPTVAGTPAITIPVVALTQTTGEALDAAMTAGTSSITWTNQFVTTPVTTAGQVVSFSSYGVTAELDLKPDLAAPGEFIFSTYPLELGGYLSQGGTSMASPHIAGTVALLLEGRPALPAWQVRDVLQNSAVPAPFGENLASGLPDHTFRQGAGMVRIDRVFENDVVVSPGKISLGEDKPAPHAVTLTLQNMGEEPRTYVLSHVAAPSASGNHFTPTKIVTDAAAVQFSPATVTVQPGGSTTVDVTITSNAALPEGALYGGYVVLTPETAPAQGDGVLRVPYAGYKGDYQLLPTITPNGKSYPWLARYGGVDLATGKPIFNNQPNGATFSTFSGSDLPYVVAFINHSPRKLILDVFQATTMKPWGRVREVDYVFQTATAADFTYYSWNGYTTLNKKTVKVPNGQYVIKMQLLRALGDENNPAHWDTWTSPVLTVNRP